MYFFARLRIDLRIGIFGIIAQYLDFPEIALQNWKSHMTTLLKDTVLAHTVCAFWPEDESYCI
jgi:hypothetical protein